MGHHHPRHIREPSYYRRRRLTPRWHHADDPIGHHNARGPNQVTTDVGEALDPRTAQDVANYTISDGITISGATLGNGGRGVTLATSTLTEDFTFTLTVDNLEDLAGNVIAPTPKYPSPSDPTQPGPGWPLASG